MRFYHSEKRGDTLTESVSLGDETSRRTKEHIIQALQQVTESSIESAKERDDSLEGLAEVRRAIQNGKIAIRVYDKAKFHTKLNLMQAKD